MFGLLIIPALPLAFWAVGKLLKLILARPRVNPRIEGGTIVITGGSSGLGLALAVELARSGAKRIVLLARDKKKLEEAKSHVLSAARNVSVDTVSVDVTVAADVKRTAEEVGTIDCLLCCAGASEPGLFGSVKDDSFSKAMELNYTASVYCARAFSAAMPGGGKIVFVGSTLSVTGLIGYTTYCPTKYAIRGLAECLRQEFRPHSIDVHMYYVGTIDTPGYIKENETKPEITKVLEGAESSDSSPKARAEALIAGLQSGEFAICSDPLTAIIQAFSNGMSVPTGIAFAMNPISAFAGLIWSAYADFMIAKDYVGRIKAQ